LIIDVDEILRSFENIQNEGRLFSERVFVAVKYRSSALCRAKLCAMAEFSVRNIFEAIYYSQTYAYVLTQLKDY